MIVVDMRVIGGTYRGRKLRTLTGQEVRPTSDRLREALFNILSPTIEDGRFLDICAGSGAVGIEALSRGARDVTFIERSRRACAMIETNLKSLGIDRQIAILNNDAVSALKKLETADERFDVVFFDPPYASDIASEVLSELASRNLLAAGGVVIVEHRVKAPPPKQSGSKFAVHASPRSGSEFTVQGSPFLRKVREVKQGESALTFYEAE